MKVQIQALHFDADQKLVDFITKKVNKLSHFYDHIIDSDVILSLENLNTQVKDKVVVIKTKIPGTTLVAKEKAKIFEEGVDMAIDSLKRQLDKHKREPRHQSIEIED